MKPTDLRGILQYIPRFRDKTFVIAADGAVVSHINFANLLLDIAVLRSLNIRVVLIHGAAEQIAQLAEMLRKPDAAVVTLAKSMPADPEIHSPHRVKVVRDLAGRAQMFSRSPIPHGDGPWMQHVGLYGFTRTALEALVQLSPTPLELREKLEQLRWLDHGWRIDVGTTTHLTPSVDTPEDLAAIEGLIADGNLGA